MRVVAGRDRVLVWRDPMRRMPWLMLVVLTVAWPFLVVQGKGAVFAVAFGAVFCGAQAGNQYGVEGSGLWLHLQTITDRVRARGEVIGHAVTALIPGTVVVLVAIAILAVVRDDYDKVPAALGVCLAALMGGHGGRQLPLGAGAVCPAAEPQVALRVQRPWPEGPDLGRQPRVDRRRRARSRCRRSRPRCCPSRSGRCGAGWPWCSAWSAVLSRCWSRPG